MASSISGPALVASRAALNSALAENDNIAIDKVAEPGEIQEVEVDMQAQADGIRTVFSDPTNFNVKVRYIPIDSHIYANISRSTPSSHHGHYGSTRL